VRNPTKTTMSFSAQVIQSQVLILTIVSVKHDQLLSAVRSIVEGVESSVCAPRRIE